MAKTTITTQDIRNNAITVPKLLLASSSGLENDGSGALRIDAADTSLALSGSGVAVALNSTGGLETSSGVQVKIPANTAGLKKGSDGLEVNLAASSGLEVVASGTGLLRIGIRGAPNYSGLNRDSGGMYIQPVANSGLQLSASGIGVLLDGSTGLQLGSGGLSLVNPVEVGNTSMTFVSGTNTTAGSGTAQYLRVGDIVVVFGILSITASAAGNSTFEMTYPFARTGGVNSGAASGNGVNAAANLLLAITGSGSAAQRWAGRFQSTGAGTYGMTCNFVYRL